MPESRDEGNMTENMKSTIKKVSDTANAIGAEVDKKSISIEQTSISIQRFQAN